MKDTQLALVLGFAIAALIVLVGVLALWMGYRLYRNGVGLSEDGSRIEWHKVRFEIRTVGGVLMLTSLGWGYVAFLIKPTLKTSAGDMVTFTLPSMKTVAPAGIDKVEQLSDADVKASFAAAAKQIEINGKSATFLDAKVERNADSMSVLSNWTTKGDKGESELAIRFSPSLEGHELRYQPKAASVDPAAFDELRVQNIR